MDSEGANLLSKFFERMRTATDEDMDKLREDYNALFVGPGHLQAPPWESVYLSEERIIFDEHTLSVREFYKDWGVTINRVNKEPDDHMGFQMEFMSILSDKGIDAIEKDNLDKLEKVLIAQNEFLEAHTLLWLDQFSKNVFDNSQTDFYKGLGLFLSEYIKMDKELLMDLISNLQDKT